MAPVSGRLRQRIQPAAPWAGAPAKGPGRAVVLYHTAGLARYTRCSHEAAAQQRVTRVTLLEMNLPGRQAGAAELRQGRVEIGDVQHVGRAARRDAAWRDAPRRGCRNAFRARRTLGTHWSRAIVSVPGIWYARAYSCSV